MARPKGAKTKKARPKSTVTRFTLTEREALKTKVQKLDRRGYNQYQIGEQLDISQGTVHNFLVEIRADYQQAYVDDRKRKAVECELALREIIAECWVEVEKLRARGKVKKTTKSGSSSGDAKEAWDEEAETVEDPEIVSLLTLISKNWTEIMALYGVRDLPAQVFAQINVNGEVGRDEFDKLGEMLLGAMGVRPRPEAVGDLPAAETVPEAGN